jgi:hypothetical protein
MEESTPDYPDHWTASARDTYENVLEQRPDLAGAEFASLEQAAELISAAELLEKVARDAGMVATGSTGQVTVHPAAVEARLGRTAAAAILARLTAPSKGGAMTNSERGRMAARARYSR